MQNWGWQRGSSLLSSGPCLCPAPVRGGPALGTRAPSSSVGLSGQAWALGPPRRSADCATRRGGQGPLRWAEREARGLGGSVWAELFGKPLAYSRSRSRGGHARGARGPERAPRAAARRLPLVGAVLGPDCGGAFARRWRSRRDAARGPASKEAGRPRDAAGPGDSGDAAHSTG